MRLRLTAGLLALSATASAAPPPPPAGQHWEPIAELSDEFNGSSLDPAKWMTKHPYANGHEDSEYRPENVSVSGGNLRLKATRIAHGDKVIGVAIASSLTPLVGPGYYEARFKAVGLPVTSSFWLQNPKTEIDVVEVFWTHSHRVASLHLHAFPNGWASNMEVGKNVRTTTPTTDWHTYGAWWRDAHSVWFYVDGEKVAEFEPPLPFDTPMYLFLDMEHMRKAGSPTDEELADPTRNTMTVDWVRSYRLSPPRP